MSKVTSFLFLVLIIALAGCGTTGDFVRSEGSINEYSREFGAAGWTYEDYLVTRSRGFAEAHESIAFQWATSNAGERILSVAFQTYSHERQASNVLNIIVDGVAFSLTDVEPEYTNVALNNDIIERNAVVIGLELSEALLSASHVQFQYVNVTNVTRDDLEALKAFIGNHLHIAMM